MYELDYLHREIGKICPIDGLSQNGDEPIEIHFKEDATEDQQKAARQYIDNFVWTDELEQQEKDNKLVAQYKDDLTIKAGYVQYKVQNSNATFLDYLKFLESLNI